MRKRPFVRHRTLLFLALALITALPIFATREVGRAAAAIDGMLDEGVPALQELDDLMQSLLDLRSGVFELSLPEGEERRGLVPEIERRIASLRTDAAELEAIDVEALTGEKRESDVQELVAKTAAQADHYVAMLNDREVDTRAMVEEALEVSRIADDAATAIDRLSGRVGYKARLIDAAVPKLLRNVRYAGVALTALALLMLGFVVVERLRYPETRRGLNRLITLGLRRQSLESPSGVPLAAEGTRPGAFVRVTKLLAQHPLHQTFLARVRLRAGAHRAWGRRYTALGALRGRLVPFVPTYARGSWNVLCALQARGIAAPVPLARATQRCLGIPTAQIVLAHDPGDVRPSKRHLLESKAFRRLPPDARAATLRSLRNFVDSLHGAGCFQLKLRNLCVRACDDGAIDAAAPDFILCNVDTVVFLPKAPAWLRVRLARHDRRRIATTIVGDLSQPEADAFFAWIGAERLAESRIAP